MNLKVLNTDIQAFINSHLDSDIHSLLLSHETIEGIPTQVIVEQIEAKRKCKEKLPTWFKTKGIYYPNKLNIEQTSSEIAAYYKAKLVSGNRLIDLTGGLGVDSYYFAKTTPEVIHIEQNPHLSEIAEYNAKQLNVNNIDFISSNGIEVLKNSEEYFDWIYIDPSRRHDVKGKVFFLKDCEPNVPQHLDLLFEKADQIMIKTAPLLDISAGLSELKHVETIHIVAIKNELKEVLWILNKENTKKITVHAVNITNKEQDHFQFDLSSEASAKVSYSEPKTYLYEPNVAIYKSGAFKSISERFNLCKLHPNSHLYTSNELIDFPGRRFKIESVLPYQKKILKKNLPNKANLTTRNFPENVQVLRKKFSIKDGGNTYLFFTTSIENNKIVVLCSKVE
ncbi:class I SAM-dependent methyltransferase [Psychroserpens sp. XS_ASV72]|uniref:THUMP-like domain-containing protein n=1 Tax=Psychroserpens sp. XS_ASV72 TaxID=3241293 RepID=UPI0035127DE0